MKIENVSAAIDNQLLSVEQKIKALTQQLAQGDQQMTAQAPGEAPTETAQAQLQQDLVTLNRIREKLIKSKNIAWEAHRLSSEPSEKQRKRQQVIGLSLCGLSLIGGLVLLYFALR